MGKAYLPEPIAFDAFFSNERCWSGHSQEFRRGFNCLWMFLILGRRCGRDADRITRPMRKKANQAEGRKWVPTSIESLRYLRYKKNSLFSRLRFFFLFSLRFLVLCRKWLPHTISPEKIILLFFFNSIIRHH